MVIQDNQESFKEERMIILEIRGIILLAKIIMTIEMIVEVTIVTIIEMIIEVIVEVTIVTIIEMIIETIIAIGLLDILIIAMEVEIMKEENINQGLIQLQINIDQIIMAIQGRQESINQGLLIGPQINIDQIIMAIQDLLKESINQGLLIGPQKVLLDKITIGHQILIVEIM